MDPLARWLQEQCEQRNLSWARASRQAGVAPNTISGIMNGQRPGLEVSRALAKYFDVSTEFALRLAGHLPPAPTADRMDPESRAMGRHFFEVLAQLPNPRMTTVWYE